jgi:pilus assembly protein CpaE
MAKGVRVAILNGQDDYIRRLRGHLLAIEGVKIVTEVQDKSMFGEVLQKWHPDVAVVDLDPDPASTLTLASEAAGGNRGCAIFAISRQTDPKLILSAMRSGVRLFLGKPLDHDQLATALQREGGRDGAQVTGRMIHVVGVCGGCGATSLATNLAVELASNDDTDVIAADLDFSYGQVGLMLDVNSEFTIADLAHSPAELEEQIIDRALVKHASGVRVIARPNDPELAAGLTASSCGHLFQELQGSFDYIVADGPIRYDPTFSESLLAADFILVVFLLSVPAVRAASRVMEDLVQGGMNVDDRVGLVVNRVHERRGGMQVKHVEQTLEKSVMASLEDDWQTVSDSINLGRPLSEHAPNSSIRQSIAKLATQIHQKG